MSSSTSGFNRAAEIDRRTISVHSPALLFLAASAIVSLITPAQVQGQMVRTAMPFTRVSNSFYERIGIDFGFSFRGTPTNGIGDRTRGVFGLGPGGQVLPNLTFSQGGVNSAIPPFGDYDPGADATFGYHLRNSSGGHHLGIRMGKGSNRSIVNTTPVLMTRSGYPGSIFNGTANPFVTGIVPVVGNGGYPIPDLGRIETTHPLELKLRQLYLERQSGISQSSTATSQSDLQSSSSQNKQSDSFSGGVNSTANRGDLSVQEIKRLREQNLENASNNEDKKVDEFVAKAKSAIAANRRGAARSYLRTAIRYASGNKQAELKEWLEKLVD